MIPLAIGAAFGIGSGIAQAIGSGKQQRRAEREAERARAEMNRQKAAFAGLDTSNPYLNMQNRYAGLENTMEDLTVNQQQAQFEAQQGQQQRANIMDQMRGAAGGSGIAALAQQMAQSGQLASQRASASIGQQEAANQMAAARQAAQLQELEAGEASRIQGLEREGEIQSRNWERDKVSTLLGMSQGETAAARETAAMHEAAKWQGIGQIGSSITSAFTGGI